jgi:hypothetical protein
MTGSMLRGGLGSPAIASRQCSACKHRELLDRLGANKARREWQERAKAAEGPATR